MSDVQAAPSTTDLSVRKRQALLFIFDNMDCSLYHFGNFCAFFSEAFGRTIEEDIFYAEEWSTRIANGLAKNLSDPATLKLLSKYNLIK